MYKEKYATKCECKMWNEKYWQQKQNYDSYNNFLCKMNFNGHRHATSTQPQKNVDENVNAQDGTK